MSRVMTVCSSVCNSSSVGTRASTKAGTPSASHQYTPSSSTLTQTSVYPREIVKGALARNAAAIFCCHNHPSGNAEPAEPIRADEHLTQTLKSAFRRIDVRVADHFVVAASTVISFAERGLL